MQILNILEIIEKKRDKKELTKEEIEYFAQGYTKGEIKDYQAAALLMAIYLNGMTKKETANLSIAMANSGDILDLKIKNKIFVDKHSTGGVGDKISLILLPLVASLGASIAKMSGRGLGFTGGTADKLESIPGYITEISEEEFIKNIEKIGISMITQTKNLAPADKKLYALRDSLSCVESIALIASSIMSKKIASGAQKIVLDVTVGNGAFMQDIKKAEELAKTMIDIGNLAGKETVCILTNMNEPLGYAVGNNLEVIEAINALKGNMSEDVKQVVLELGAYMLKLAELGDDISKNKEKLLENIYNGKAFEKFKQLVQNQGGDISYIENTDKFQKAKIILEVKANNSGNITSIPAKEIGKLASFLGAGRINKEDKIDHSVGIVLNKKVGEKVEAKETIAKIYANDLKKAQIVLDELEKIIKIEEKEVSIKYIYEIIT